MTIDVGIDHLIGDVSTRRTEKSPAPKVVKNRVAAFAVLGHGGPIFEQAGILTRARTEVFPA